MREESQRVPTVHPSGSARGSLLKREGAKTQVRKHRHPAVLPDKRLKEETAFSRKDNRTKATPCETSVGFGKGKDRGCNSCEVCLPFLARETPPLPPDRRRAYQNLVVNLGAYRVRVEGLQAW